MSSGERSDRLTLDRLFDLLADAERRCALRTLCERDGATTLGDLADEIVARSESSDARTGSETAYPDQRERTATALHHKHLPKLVDAGVVAYDPETSRVELDSGAPQLEPYLQAADGK